MAVEDTYQEVFQNATKYTILWGTAFFGLAAASRLFFDSPSLATRSWSTIIIGSYLLGVLFGAIYLVRLVAVWKNRNDIVITELLPLPERVTDWIQQGSTTKSIDDVTWKDAAGEELGVFLGFVATMLVIKEGGRLVTGSPVLEEFTYPAIVLFGLLLTALNGIKFVLIGARKLYRHHRD